MPENDVIHEALADSWLLVPGCRRLSAALHCGLGVHAQLYIVNNLKHFPPVDAVDAGHFKATGS
eukprot:2157712-Pleurochrysis_carterae.AAC.1